MIYENIEQTIGNTPLVKLNRLKKELGLHANILVKLEYFNPAGSVKDRAALFMLNQAEKEGIIKDNATIIEATSGNTGIGLAMVCASRGYTAVIVMPNTMSVERVNLLKAYGATVVLTDGKLGMKGAIDKANEIKNATPNSFIPSQFDNEQNLNSHYQTTAREIVTDTQGNFDFIVAGIGSGGTVSGIGKYLKEINHTAKVIGVEPESSPLITKGVAGSHKIQGIGANFIPKNYKAKFVDQVLVATDNNAFEYTNLLAKIEGILVGISAGASLSVAVELAKLPENKEKNIVVLLADGGERYLSTGVFD